MKSVVMAAKRISATWILRSVALFLAMVVVFAVLPGDFAAVLLPLVLLVSFVVAAVKAPPVAIAILLYYSMILGSWFILAAAPVTILLARRYQRHRLLLDLNPDHIRRTTLFAMAALVATLPFIDFSLGPWSSRAQSSSFDSARPLIEQAQPGEESALQRFAQWLGFGPDGQEFQQGPLVPRARQLPEDESFNWWIVVLIVLIVALLALAYWLWRQIKSQEVGELIPVAATPLARLEAIGATIGRPRRASEGAITYGQVLAEHTGDHRLAQAGPLVSGQVYQSPFANPGAVSQNLDGIESAPPPPLPEPSAFERISARMGSVRISLRALSYATLALTLIVIALVVLLPRLGDLETDQFQSGLSAMGQAIAVADF